MWYGVVSKENLTEQYSNGKIPMLHCYRPLYYTSCIYIPVTKNVLSFNALVTSISFHVQSQNSLSKLNQ